MNKENYKQLALLAALVIAIIFTGVFFASNKSLKRTLKGEKLISESLLSEKLSLNKNMEKLSIEVGEVKGRNSQMERRVGEMSKELDEKMNELRKAMNENATLRGFRAKARELETLTAKLTEDLNNIKKVSEEEKLKSASDKQKWDEQLAALLKENGQLTTTNTILSAMASNNHRIEAVRGKNDRQTVRARRTQKLVFSFELPANVGSDIQFQVNCPDGNVFESKNNKAATVKVVNSSRNFFASTTEIHAVETKTIEMSYIPENKLKKGNYEFKVYNEGRYIGSSRFSLR